MMKPRKKIEYCVDDDGCHICTSHAQSKGYPCISVNGKKTYISRVVYMETYGDIPKGLVVRHTCDNRSCINPKHLILGTYADNSRDMVSRSRQAKGEKVNTSKLTRKDVEVILSFPHTTSNTEIANLYNVAVLNISRIRRGIIWKDVPRPEGYKYLYGNTGQSNGSSKLTEASVKLIRADKSSTNRELAFKYNVSESVISSVRNNKTWKHVK